MLDTSGPMETPILAYEAIQIFPVLSLFSMDRYYHATPWTRQAFQLRDTCNALEQRCKALQAWRIWQQQENAKYGLPWHQIPREPAKLRPHRLSLLTRHSA
jgi:hypothetical protein